ncbi:MAG: sugar phosphate nucleotidyltransferase [Myxococcales bacterium]|nr:sugar phosphate nucleotidyltransferase [Myxococcales bacterium]MDD9970361.1 sugar phosphate nucleotidyltransferase [Myxococcales bacterium]
MKVVLFCGGQGTRLREYSGTVPKPLVPIGHQPILLHLMRYYAHFGHTEFVLCLGYGGEMIRQFFMGYDARNSEDFVMDQGRSKLRLPTSDVLDWKIHFVDTGVKANVGERLVAVRDLVADEELFLANYSDQLTDMDLNVFLAWRAERDPVASFLAVRPSQTFHIVGAAEDGQVESFRPAREAGLRINGGFMALKPSVFEYIRPGEELVEQPLARLIDRGEAVAYRYDGFWKAMDTYKDKVEFDSLDDHRERPWMVWR